MPYKDPDARRAYAAAYYRANKDRWVTRHLAIVQPRREADREAFNASRRRWYAEHRESRTAYDRQRSKRRRDWLTTGARVVLAGEMVRISTLPPELREVAKLIRETRAELRTRPRRTP